MYFQHVKSYLNESNLYRFSHYCSYAGPDYQVSICTFYTEIEKDCTEKRFETNENRRDLDKRENTLSIPKSFQSNLIRENYFGYGHWVLLHFH